MASTAAVFAADRESEASVDPSRAPVATAEDAALAACLGDYTWAVDTQINDSATGVQTIVDKWGVNDGRYQTAVDFYVEFANERFANGEEAAVELVVGLIREHCESLSRPAVVSEEPPAVPEQTAGQGEFLSAPDCEGAVVDAVARLRSGEFDPDPILGGFTPSGQQLIEDMLGYLDENNLGPKDAGQALGSGGDFTALCYTPMGD